MTHFEAYQWEDHVPRAGGWKFNLAAGLLALGLIYAALPHASSDTPAAAAAVPARVILDPDIEISNAPAIQPVRSWWAYCPTATSTYADS
jgi:hypothetical protein